MGIYIEDPITRYIDHCQIKNYNLYKWGLMIWFEFSLFFLFFSTLIYFLYVMDDRSTKEKDSRQDFHVQEKEHFDVDENGDIRVEPTEEDWANLREISDKIPKAAYLVILVEFCERFTFYGLTGPFQNYIQNPAPESCK
jgi:hypothetical protein